MKIVIKATKIELTPEIREEIDTKIGELEKFITAGTLTSCYVEVERTTFHHKKGYIFRAEANIELPGTLLRAEAQRETLSQAITELKDELQRELKKYKNRQEAKRRRGGRMLKRLKNYSPLAWGQERFFKGRRDRDI